MTNLARALVRPLEGQIALVTGASRGVGRGIALQLGQAGATVYITGRRPSNALSSTEVGLTTLDQTAKEISNRGGEPIPVYCDHSNSDDVKKLFERISTENSGTLDILVNNAYSGVTSIFGNAGRKFYECEPEMWDEVNDVGLRNAYICCVYAARLMANRKSGLIVNISSAGGLQYLFNVAYGVGKAAIDRMSADMAFELKDQGVTVVSLWPGAVKTELLEIYTRKGALSSAMNLSQEVIDASMKGAETPEFVGKAVVALSTDKNKHRKTGKILMTADLANEYRFSDITGLMPANTRSIRSVMGYFGWLRMAKLVPSFIKIPKLMMHFGSYKF